MKRILLSATILLLFTFQSRAQAFGELIDKSLSLLKADDIGQLQQTYIRLYDEYLKENLPEYQNAVDAVEEGDFSAAIGFLGELIDEDILLDEMAEDPNFIPLHGTTGWKELLENIEEITSGYDNPLRLELKEIQQKDQGIMLLYMYTSDPVLKQTVHRLMKEVDDESALRVTAILDENGWCGPDQIGSEANETLFLAIQHVDDLKVQQRYLPMLAEAVRTGNAEGWHLAFLTDRILMNRGEKQIYGTQKIVSDDPSQSYLIPLQYPGRVDELRSIIGMDPLADDLEEEGWHWDLEEYLQNLPAIEKMYNERYQSLQNDRK